ncbi:MAG: DUF2961 domain-containing protein [Oscillospiraceae bacterium]|nr:DUF2961 domain-containing protein [Oscillospiraceae bacterium]MDD4413434.1 DUF2961 domain-containing protein [Oscillospiraceae bacterium]
MINKLNNRLDGLYLLSNAKTRSISAENKTGEKGGGGRDGGKAIEIAPGETAVIADIRDCGMINSMWFGGHIGSELVIRFYWDDLDYASVECPLNAFFAYGIPSNVNHFDGNFPILNSIPVVVAPCRGMSCYWQMPFRTRCRITVENVGTVPLGHFYQITYTLTELPEEASYFHAAYREKKPVALNEPYVVIDGIKGKGQYVGTALFAKLNKNNSCWVEGEFKFFIDGDDLTHPTINYTGTEDYLCGSYAFCVNGRYHTYSTPYAGMYSVVHSDGTQGSMHDSFMGYRWHLLDPIRFESDLRVTVMNIGWNETTTQCAPRTDDYSSVAYWYQTIA